MSMNDFFLYPNCLTSNTRLTRYSGPEAVVVVVIDKWLARTLSLTHSLTHTHTETNSFGCSYKCCLVRLGMVYTHTHT